MICKSTIKKLRNYLNKLGICKEKSIIKIPAFIDDPERIVRIIFPPNHVTKNNKIKSNAFRSKSGIDEVSTIRLDYTSTDFCKQYGKKHQNATKKREYLGLAVLYASKIRQIKADVVSTPEAFPAHSDIKIGYVTNIGEQLPAEFSFKVKQLATEARLYKDYNIESDKWEGENPI